MALPTPSSIIESIRTWDSTAKVQSTYLVPTIKRLQSTATPGLQGPTDAPDLAPNEIAGLIDHTQLRPTATPNDYEQCFTEAEKYKFASVCIPTAYVPDATKALAEAQVAVCTVVGFPLGHSHPEVKAAEAQWALQHGANEIDMVLHVGAVKAHDWARVERGIRTVVNALQAEPGSPILKVILETALLTDAEKAVACYVADRAGADFVKTSTGFSTGGATVEDVALMRHVVDDEIGVKASGGVGSAADVAQMVAYGATRIGASGSVGIREGVTNPEAAY
jgi:deoxyribose-phosphate aldolase